MVASESYFMGAAARATTSEATYVASLLNALDVRYRVTLLHGKKTGHTFVFSQMFGLPVHSDIEGAGRYV